MRQSHRQRGREREKKKKKNEEEEEKRGRRRKHYVYALVRILYKQSFMLIGCLHVQESQLLGFKMFEADVTLKQNQVHRKWYKLVKLNKYSVPENYYKKVSNMFIL